MIFEKSLRIADLATGLTSIICVHETDPYKLDAVCNLLGKETHETIFARAQEIASEYGAMMRIEEMPHEEMFLNAIQGFSIGHCEAGWFCAVWGDIESGPILPHDQSILAETCKPPEVWTVFRSYPIMVH